MMMSSKHVSSCVRKISTIVQTNEFVARKAEDLLQKQRMLRMGSQGGLSHVAGHRSYVLFSDAARLERVLLIWTMKQLVNRFGFKPVVVPNLVYDDVVRSCGFDPDGVRSQVYKIAGFSRPADEFDSNSNKRSVCLSGTSEIPLVSLHMGRTFDVDSGEKSEQLPLKYCALSRCYRAETSTVEKGLYRVHYFNKVEMVSIVQQEESEKTLDEFVEIQKWLFDQLQLNYEVRDMPPEELGPAARKKIDIEAYFPGRKTYGEISSASDCSDRQSKNLDIRYRRLATDDELSGKSEEDQEPFVTKYVHTVNGTACATPRILLPIIESHQESDGNIRIPEVLRSHMNDQEFLQPVRW